jgi:UDP-GlcNAc:undecaprenyl-phosphate/decaprenyl-phosphate GlcNAc-1-phosphate transferase
VGGYLVAFAVAAVMTFVLTPIVRRGAIAIGAVVQPDERRVHAVPTPTLGGLAMLLAFLMAMGVAAFLPQFRPIFFEGSSEPYGVILAAIVIFAVGLLDDLREVSAPAKLAGQAFGASVLFLLGVTLLYFRVPFAGTIVLSPDWAPLVTVLWVAVMTNAVNLMDGLDGLAAGIVAIAAGAFFFYGYHLSDINLLTPDNVGPLVTAIACGLCVGFLPHNFHPAKVFMGDSGALLLGLLLAASTMSVGGRTDDQFSGQTYFFFAPLFIGFVILGVPILDTVFAIVRRVGRRVAVSQPDKEHLHHRLMRLGHGHRRAVLILWAWTAILSGVVLVPTYTGKGNAAVLPLIAGLGVGLYTLLHPDVRSGRHLTPVGDTKEQRPPAA